MIVSGGVSRRTVSPAVPTSRPALEAGCGDRVRPDDRARRRAAGRGREPRARPGAPRAPAASLLAVRRTDASRALVDRLDDRAGGRARDRVAAKGAGVVAGRETLGAPSATSSAPIGSPFASALREHERVRARRRAAPRRRSCRCGRRRTAPRRRRAARRARRRARAPRRGTRASPGGSRPRPAPARSGSPAVSGPTSRGERLDVVQVARSATAGASGSHGARLAGWPGRRRARRACGRGTSSRARRRPACPSPCAPTSAPPRSPRCRSCRRRPARRRSASESRPARLLHRLGRVEVRRVPEQVELRVRGRERRRMAVAERDDGDPAEQVEVAASRRHPTSHAPSPETNVTSARA